MAVVTPHYRGFGGNYRVFENRGFEGMALEWETAIREGASWVEIVTWNDWGESSYVAPFGTPNQTSLWGGHWGPLLSHVAYLDASRYYIDWYKAGTPPRIVQDSLYYFYRLHPKTGPGLVKPDDKAKKMGRPGGADRLVDNVFVTSFLTAPAQLTIYSGSTEKRFDVKSGVEHVSMPFAPGKQRFVLTRGGKCITDKTGEHEISATDAWGDYNYFAGETSNSQ